MENKSYTYYCPGDLVYCSGRAARIDIISLVNVQIGVKFLDNGESDIVDPDIIVPIPLTKTMLQLNGFEFSKSDEEAISSWRGWWIYEGLEFGVLVDSNDPDADFPINAYITDSVIRIGSVHEVQQFLRLVGYIEVANNFRLESLSFEEFRDKILEKVNDAPIFWRRGQAVFNVIDSMFPGLAREVQFEEKIDCFYDDSEVDSFITASYVKYCSKYEKGK